MKPEIGNGIDLVMPLYNEAEILNEAFASLQAQTDAAGEPLPRGFFRVFAVDNASTDGTGDLLRALANDTSMPEIIVLGEEIKGVVQARVRGSERVLQEAERERAPYVLHMDADNFLTPTLVYDAWSRLHRKEVDALTYAGYRPTDFWQRVPALAERTFREMGSVDFTPANMEALGFDPDEALLTPQILHDFEQFPVQWAFALTKEAFDNAGGYIREFHDDGTERLGEARNLMYRVVRTGARTAYVNDPWVTLHPRRLLLDAEQICTGKAYVGGMRDIRGSHTDEHYAELNRLAPSLDFRPLRRNFVQRCILEPCLAKPELVNRQSDYFGSDAAVIREEIERWHQERGGRMYLDVWPLSMDLVERYADDILERIAERRDSA